MKTVLIISTDPQSTGGVSSVVNTLLESDLKDSYRILQLSTHKHGTFTQKLISMTAAYLRFPFVLLFNKIDLIHIHGSLKSSFMRKSVFLLAAKAFGIKVIYHMHCAMVTEYFEQRSSLKQKLVIRLFNLYDRVIVLGRFWEKMFTEYGIRNLEVVYNPVTVKSAGLTPHDGINVTFMGLIGSRKGVYDIIKAAGFIQNPDVKILLYGNGEINNVKEIVQNENLSHIISVCGWIEAEKLDEAYRNTDIYILPSYSEGLPMSVLEAMSYGLPVISTPVGGTPEAIEDNVNGYLIPPGDYKALAEKIELLAANKELRNSMGAKNLQTVAQKFDINVITARLRQIYEELC